MPYERRGPRPTRWQRAAVRRGARLPIEAGVVEHLTHDRLQRGRLQVCGQRLGGSPGLGPRGGEVCLGEEERQQPRRRQLVAAWGTDRRERARAATDGRRRRARCHVEQRALGRRRRASWRVCWARRPPRDLARLPKRGKASASGVAPRSSARLVMTAREA